MEEPDQQPSDGPLPASKAHQGPDREKMHFAVRGFTALFLITIVGMGAMAIAIPLSRAQRMEAVYYIVLILVFYIISIVFVVVAFRRMTKT